MIASLTTSPPIQLHCRLPPTARAYTPPPPAREALPHNHGRSKTPRCPKHDESCHHGALASSQVPRGEDCCLPARRVGWGDSWINILRLWKKDGEPERGRQLEVVATILAPVTGPSIGWRGQRATLATLHTHLASSLAPLTTSPPAFGTRPCFNSKFPYPLLLFFYDSCASLGIFDQVRRCVR